MCLSQIGDKVRSEVQFGTKGERFLEDMGDLLEVSFFLWPFTNAALNSSFLSP